MIDIVSILIFSAMQVGGNANAVSRENFSSHRPISFVFVSFRKRFFNNMVVRPKIRNRNITVEQLNFIEKNFINWRQKRWNNTEQKFVERRKSNIQLDIFVRSSCFLTKVTNTNIIRRITRKKRKISFMNIHKCQHKSFTTNCRQFRWNWTREKTKN